MANHVNGNSTSVPVQKWIELFLVEPSINRGSARPTQATSMLKLSAKPRPVRTHGRTGDTARRAVSGQMRRSRRLVGCQSGAAAVEMALVAPILLGLLFGSTELGQLLPERAYPGQGRSRWRPLRRSPGFFQFHKLQRIAGRDSRRRHTTLVMTGLLSGGANKLSHWTSTTISVTSSCTTTTGGQTLGGNLQRQQEFERHADRRTDRHGDCDRTLHADPASAFGFTGTGYNLNASQQAAVTGI